MINQWKVITPDNRPDSYTLVTMTIEETLHGVRTAVFAWLDSHNRIIVFGENGIKPQILAENWKAIAWIDKPEPLEASAVSSAQSVGI
jgi:hypothetical protein